MFAWVMCCKDWARDLFNTTLKKHSIPYTLRPQRLAFYCYHMFFLYLGEFLEDYQAYDNSESIIEYLSGSWIDERTQFADSIES